MARRYCTVALTLVLGACAAAASGQTTTDAGQAAPTSARFSVFIQGVPLGNEDITSTVSSSGLVVRSSGRLGSPIDLSTSRFEVKYDAQWRPTSMEIEAVLRGQPFIVRSAFANGSVASDIIQSGAQSQKTDKVAPDTVVLPNMFFGAYEAVALRLQTLTPPVSLRAYIAPQAEIAIQVLGVSDERIRTTDRLIAAKRYTIVFGNPSGPMPGELWADEGGHLLRFRIPTQALEVARGDVSAVSARVERLARENDEQVFIPSNGFNLAGTLSKPSASSAQAPAPAPADRKRAVPRLPVVVLVSGSGPADRDEAVSGVPIFAQLANTLADAGFMVLRYDKRGVGQSGGRAESASIRDYADDLRAAITFLTNRKDVDPARIAVAGYSEGGLVGMLVASQMKKQVRALALLATPGTAGGELVLEQQRYLLDRMSLPPEELRNRIALQERIQVAVLTGGGWETIPPAYRRQADTPWFRSYLEFRPNEVLPKVEQPVAIIQGSVDRQVPARHAQLLMELAKSRKKDPGEDLFMVEGINHLLVPASSGDTEEYSSLTDKNVSVKVINALTTWLKDRLNVAAASAGR